VSPTTATAAVGGVPVTFAATVAHGSVSGLVWQVNGIPGGSGTVGTISASGHYISPGAMPPDPTITITAVSVNDPAASGSATLVLTLDPLAVTVTVTPATATVVAGTGTQAFTAVVANSSNSAVTWQVNGVTGGNATVGTISPTGLYTAPSGPPAQPTVTITAVSVADSGASGSAAATVVASAPPPPTITGTAPLTIAVGQTYSFQPAAASPRNGTLTFAIQNPPSWASFNTATGQLSGTPSASNVGVYSNITISVSDGTATASLAPFAISVVQTASGTATLAWTIPTTRTDGTVLSNLAGFNIYWGTSPGSLPNKVSIANPTVSTYIFDNLSSGTYYFVATAYDASGLESAYTPIASKTVP
jgi:hypothetical protein